MPYAAPKFCVRHPKQLLKRGERCPLCPKPPSNWGKYQEQQGNRHQRGYGNDWYKLRNAVFARDTKLCQVCMKKNILTPATEVDHIIPKSQGGTNTMDNLQAICKTCHKKKTQAESKRKRQ